MTDLDRIIQLAEDNHSMFKTKMIVDAGIRKEKIKELLDSGRIEKISRGYYKLVDTSIDDFYNFQQRCPKGIFSYATAAYILKLTDAYPANYDYTVQRGYNASRTNFDDSVQFHYVSEEIFSMGLTQRLTPNGAWVTLYDKERTVCDFIKYRKKVDMSIFSEVVNNYFKGRDKDLKKLIQYGKLLHIMDELELYAELLQ